MAERVAIDGAVLTQEIATLASIRAQSITTTVGELTSKGHAAEVANHLSGVFMSLDDVLNTLIDQTSAFLVNVQDGFADVDTEAAAAAARLAGEVAG